MKSIIKYIAVLAAILTISSCEDLRFGDAFLEKPAGADVTIDTIFSKKVLAENFLASAYSTLYYGFCTTQGGPVNNRMNLDMLDALTDLVQSNPNRGAAQYYAGAVNAGYEDTSDGTKYGFNKEGAWEGIRMAYIFIENVDRVQDMTPQEKRVRAGEAKMIIACHYADMYRHFGGLPWVSKALYPGDDLNSPRLTVEETINHITALLDEAAADLPWALSNPAVDDGRFTKAAAMALKIRLLLFTASPLFNSDQPYMAGEASDKRMTWLGGKDMNWYVKAEDACKAFFDSLSVYGYNYGLVNNGDARSSFIEAYHKRGNNEILISTRKVYKSFDFWNANYYFYQAAGAYGTTNPTLEAINIFQFADGTNFDWNNPAHAANPFTTSTGTLNRDPRLYETVMIQGDRMQNKRLDIFDGPTKGWVRTQWGNTNNWLTGHNIRKFLRERVAGNGLSEVVQWPYLRLAEIYLSYAEILNELGKEGEAYSYINAVRTRVGMPDVNAKGNLGQIALREEILNERVRELMYEDVRWYDIIRWKREDIFQKRLRGLNVYSPNNGTTLTFNIFDLTQDRVWRTNFSPKWYLSPFPPSEVYKGYGLIQNPGW